MRQSASPSLDIDAVLATCLQRAGDSDPSSREPVTVLLERLDPERWALEWHLPWWLGHTFGLRPDLCFELVVSDVLGLASIRLEDDLADGDVPSDEVERNRALVPLLYEEALRPYRAWFATEDPIWGRIDAWIDEWRRSGEAEGIESDRPGAGTDGALARRRLAARAAPLRIPAYATCSLAGRRAEFELVERCLDHALMGLVLYDHLCDREDDLRAGRWNALVAEVSALPQTLEHGEPNRVALTVALMTGGAADALGARIEREMRDAASLSEALGCPPLTAYLRRTGARAREQARGVDAHYRGVADRATQLLFGDREGASIGSDGAPPGAVTRH